LRLEVEKPGYFEKKRRIAIATPITACDAFRTFRNRTAELVKSACLRSGLRLFTELKIGAILLPHTQHSSFYETQHCLVRYSGARY
jgi:hypothetical protein